MIKCLYNLELLILSTADTPFQPNDEPIRADAPRNYVRELNGTDVDAVMICPTAWKRPLWPSKVDPHWTEEAVLLEPKYFTADLTYQEKAYYRLREYMLAGNDPVFAAVDECSKQGIAPFISYRMNDHHYLYDKDAFIHPKFWKNNPQYWLCNSPNADRDAIALDKSNRFFNYIFKEVRDYYFSLLEELVCNYDVAGIELDFMRSPHFFVKNDLEEGKAVMTEFVKRVKHMLDSYGEKRSKKLKLCVRVPLSIEKCLEAGLDVETWDKLGIVDMINVSTFFISGPVIEADSFKKAVKNASTYGEIHPIVDQGTIYNGFDNNVSRKIKKEMISGLAHDFLDRGFDGVSFFNFPYTRDHFFHEPRRLGMKCSEPPFDVLKGITDKKVLAKRDKDYFLNRFFPPMPMRDNLDCSIYIADEIEKGSHKHAILRLETEKPCQQNTIKAWINGTELEEICWLGELFVPLNNEALPRLENLKFYKVPVEILKHGYNEIKAENMQAYHWLKSVTYNTVELGLYKNNTILESELQ